MTTLRITGGSMRGRRVPVPPDEVRPTSERARQAYFNIIGARLEGAHFLDLFSGSGIFSFEALSRGAASATAVDASRKHIEGMTVVANGLGVSLDTVASEALNAINRLRGRVFDLVYADPPYDYQCHNDLLTAIDQHLELGPEAIVAIEHRRRTEPFTHTPQHLAATRRAEYSEVWISFFERPSTLLKDPSEGSSKTS